tara:strand:- start:236 stop:991 length:756 start_codon:yes stop_codon:yes gene_type:complete
MAAKHKLDCSHIPFPMPEKHCTLYQNWINLTFMHWKVDAEKIKPYLPEGLEIDLFEGHAYVGLIPFTMEKVRPRLLPWLPFVSTFGEFNIRTYVVKDGIPGVLFLTLEAQSRVTCFHAPRSYGLPYRYAKAKVKVNPDGDFEWKSVRTSGGETLIGSAQATGPELKAKENTLEYFLFERYSLYTGHRGVLHRAYTHHQPWKYTLAKVNIEANTLLQSYDLGIEDLHSPEYVHMSSGVQVRTWSVDPVEVIS